MTDLTSGEELNFKVNRWMSRSEDDRDVWRELPVVRKGQKTPTRWGVVYCSQRRLGIVTGYTGKSLNIHSVIHSVVLSFHSVVLSFIQSLGARCSSVVRAFAHGAMGCQIDHSWGGPIELFLIPASAPRLV